MELDLATAKGWYFYENRGASLWLSGTNQAGNLRLEERSEGDKVSGSLDLRWNSRRLSGTWHSADRQRRLPVSLDLAAEYVTVQRDYNEDYGHSRLTWPVLVRTNEGLACFVNAHCQAELRQEAKSFRQLCKETLAGIIKEYGGLPAHGWYLVAGFRVRYYSSNYVSLVHQRWEDWGDGGTRAMDEASNYVWRKGKAVRIEVSNLVRAPKSTVRLAEWVVGDLRRQFGTNSVHAFLPEPCEELMLLQPWAWRPGGLVFYFDPADLLAGDNGPSEVYLDNAGRLSNLLKHPKALKTLGLRQP